MSAYARTDFDALDRREATGVSFQSVISFCKGLATVTAGGGGAGREGFWRPGNKTGQRRCCQDHPDCVYPHKDSPVFESVVTSDHDLQC